MNITNRVKAHEEIDRIFLDLLPRRGMAVREAQVRLCHNMLDSMDDGRIALCDAGVGLGKTYAYLTAGILFRKYTENASERPILVTTASIALQNAVLGEYIPFLSEVMLEAGIIEKPLKAALRKGKTHYACDDRLLKRLSKANLEKKNERNKRALLSLKTHLDLDDVAHLSAYDRNQVCVPGMCDCHLTDCRYQRFVRDSRSPEYVIQVCNHNFFLADAIHRNTGIDARYRSVKSPPILSIIKKYDDENRLSVPDWDLFKEAVSHIYLSRTGIGLKTKSGEELYMERNDVNASGNGSCPAGSDGHTCEPPAE